MNEIRQQPPTPRGSAVAKQRKRIPESKNNSVRATGYAVGTAVMTFMIMFRYEVESFRCKRADPGFFTVCKPLGMTPPDFVHMLFYLGIALGVIALVMIVLTFILKLADFPRWTVVVFKVIFTVVGIGGIPFVSHYV